MITFKANYVSNAAIDRYYSQTNSKKHPASFVRLNPTDERDILALLKTKNIWGKSEFGGTLYDRALFMHYDNENSEDKEIYFLPPCPLLYGKHFGTNAEPSQENVR